MKKEDRKKIIDAIVETNMREFTCHLNSPENIERHIEWCVSKFKEVLNEEEILYFRKMCGEVTIESACIYHYTLGNLARLRSMLLYDEDDDVCLTKAIERMMKSGHSQQIIIKDHDKLSFNGLVWKMGDVINYDFTMLEDGYAVTIVSTFDINTIRETAEGINPLSIAKGIITNMVNKIALGEVYFEDSDDEDERLV